MNDDEILIEAGRTEGQYWRDVWRYRELLYFLSWRDVLVRYKQTLLGVAWALVRPLLAMLAFTVVFGRLAKLPSDGVPYPILVFAGLLPWQFASTTLSDSGASLLSNSTLISKVYFPRLIVPTSAVAVGLLDAFVSLLLLAALMGVYGYWPSGRVVALPFFALIAVALSLGTGVWLAALTVRYRDFRLVVPFLLQLGIYLSPVGFSSSVIPERWRLVYSLNPLVGVIDGFRWSLLRGDAGLYWPAVALSAGLAVAILASGLRYFRRTERTFADVI